MSSNKRNIVSFMQKREVAAWIEANIGIFEGVGFGELAILANDKFNFGFEIAGGSLWHIVTDIGLGDRIKKGLGSAVCDKNNRLDFLEERIQFLEVELGVNKLLVGNVP